MARTVQPSIVNCRPFDFQALSMCVDISIKNSSRGADQNVHLNVSRFVSRLMDRDGNTTLNVRAVEVRNAPNASQGSHVKARLNGSSACSPSEPPIPITAVAVTQSIEAFDSSTFEMVSWLSRAFRERSYARSMLGYSWVSSSVMGTGLRSGLCVSMIKQVTT